MRRSESHRRGLAYETWLRTRTLPAQRNGGNAGTRTQLVRRRLVYSQARSHLPSTFPWGDRPDSHRLERGPHPRASYPSASITVRLGGFAPPTFRLSSDYSAVELQTGNAARSLRQRSTRQESHLRPRGPGPRALLLSYAKKDLVHRLGVEPITLHRRPVAGR